MTASRYSHRAFLDYLGALELSAMSMPSPKARWSSRMNRCCA